MVIENLYCSLLRVASFLRARAHVCKIRSAQVLVNSCLSLNRSEILVRMAAIFLLFGASGCSWYRGMTEWGTAAPVNSYDWPVVNADKYLTEYKNGGTVQATTPDGKSVAFIVIDTYDSGAGRQCKKYTVDTALHVACYDGAWYPVRTFEEK